MVVDSLRSRHPKKRFNVISLRKIYLSVWNHPFVVITLLFFVCLYRYFPYVFSLLVTISPVLVCTAVLLGAILVHGQPNDPKSRVESRGGESLRTDVEHWVFSENKFAEVSNNIIEKNMEVSGMLGARIRVIDSLSKGVDWEYGDIRAQNHNKSECGSCYSSVWGDPDLGSLSQAQKPVEKHDRVLHVEVDVGMRDKLGMFTYQYNHLPQTPHLEYSPRPQEIFPLLDTEDSPCHKNASHDASLESEMQSYVSNEEVDYIVEEVGDDDDEEEETGVSEDDDDDDDDDDEDEDEEEDDENEENVEEKDESSKTVMAWTEEDETNLRALGTSELERNQRLENLLARRRVQRNFSMISERNLIDLDFAELPSFQGAPISTTRVNPFDVTPDNVPPIPGSAPSVTVPRKNPFDSPMASPRRAENPIEESPEEEEEEELTESDLKNPMVSSRSDRYYLNTEGGGGGLEPEKSVKEPSLRRYGSFSSGYDFMADAYREDSMQIDRRNAMLSRHESFNVRPPFSSILTQEKPTRRHWRPVFVPEQLSLASEEIMHPSLDRSLSQLSDESSESSMRSLSNSESSSSHENFEEVGPDEAESTTDSEETIPAADCHFFSDSDDESERDDPEDDEQKNKSGSEDDFDTAASSSSMASNGNQFEDAEMKEFDVEHNMSDEEDRIHEEMEPVYDESPSSTDKNTAFCPTSD